MRRLRALAVLFALTMMLMPAAAALAQDATPGADPNAEIGTRGGSPDAPGRAATDVERLDLAAMALSSDDLDVAMTLSFEAYLSGAQVVDQLLAGTIPASEVEATGLRWYYESQYQSADGSTRIRSYVEEYDSAAGARAGFDLLENEDNFLSDGVAYVDEPGLEGIGESPSEVTTSTVESSEGAPSGASMDATFRVGRLLAGVAIDTVSTTAPDEAELLTLATRLEERIRAVLDGDEINGIDSSLATGMLNFEGGQDIQEGYVSLADAFGDAVPPAALEGFQSGYLHAVALGMETNPDLPLPLVSISVSTFASEDGPLAVLTAADEVTPPFSLIERIDLDIVPGATAAVGFSFSSPLTGGEPDSVRLMVVAGDRLITIDVQGGGTLDQARDAALSLAEQQLACTKASEACGNAELPNAFAPVAVG